MFKSITMRILKTYFLLLLIICFCSNIIAQDSLSLLDAIQIGLKKNFDIQISAKNIEANKLQNTWGQAGRYPSVDLNIQQGNSISDQSNNPLSIVQQLIYQNSIQGAANLNWVLFNGFRVKANKLKLNNLEAQSEGNATLVIENTIQGIILSYYSSNLQKEKMDLLKNVLKLSRDKYLHEKEKGEMGFATTVDQLQFESAYLSDSSAIIMQELAYKNTIKNLNLFLGVDINLKWNLTDKLLPENTIYNYEELESKMLGNNANIKNQIVNIELLKQDVSLAKASMFPVVSFNSGASYNTSRLQINDFPMPGVNTSNTANINYFANFTVGFKIFDGGKVKRAIQAVQIQEDITNLNMDKLKHQLTQELSSHYEIYNTRIAIFEVNLKSFAVAKRSFEIAQLRKNAGIINSFDLRNIEMVYLQTGTALFEAIYNIQESKINLTRLTGGIIDTQD
jgi:outer membrane protein